MFKHSDKNLRMYICNIQSFNMAKDEIFVQVCLEQYLSGHGRINPQCRSVKIKLQELIPMWINKDHCRSILISADQSWSILLNKDQCGSMPIITCIDPHWSLLSKIYFNWSAIIFIVPYFGSIPEIWSLLISIDSHWWLIWHVLIYNYAPFWWLQLIMMGQIFTVANCSQ